MSVKIETIVEFDVFCSDFQKRLDVLNYVKDFFESLGYHCSIVSHTVRVENEWLEEASL